MKIEDLTGRLIRLETAMELALLAKRSRAMEDTRYTAPGLLILLDLPFSRF